MLSRHSQFKERRKKMPNCIDNSTRLNYNSTVGFKRDTATGKIGKLHQYKLAKPGCYCAYLPMEVERGDG
jgi:hypothetical protein